MPQQSVSAMRVAFGVRAQYVTIMALSVVMVTQILGVAIFSGRSQAAGTVSYKSQFSTTQYRTDYPVSVTSDSSGNIYIFSNNKVKKFDASRNYLSEWGTSGTGTGQFNTDSDHRIAVDSSGNIFVLEATRVQKFSNSGTYSTLYDATSLGAEINSMAVDATGNVYVTGTGLSSIVKLSNNLTGPTNIGSAGSGNGQLSFPYALATDSSDNLYVSDVGNSRIQRFNSSGAYSAKFTVPSPYTATSISVDTSGNVYTYDYIYALVRKFTMAGATGASWGGNDDSGDPTCVPSKFGNDPNQIRVDARAGSNRVYVTDSQNNRVQAFEANGTFVSQIGKCANGQLDRPGQLAKDDAGNIYVADNETHRIQKFDSVGSPVADWQINDPGQISVSEHHSDSIRMAVGPSGKIYAIDTSYRDSYTQYRLHVYNSDGTEFLSYILPTYSGASVYDISAMTVDSNEMIYYQHGDMVFKIASVNGATVSSWPSAYPGNNSAMAMATDSERNVYLYSGSSITKYNETGTQLAQFNVTPQSAAPSTATPPYIAIGSDNSIFVTSRHNIQKLTQDGRLIAMWGSAGSGTNQFGNPGGIVIANAGDIYVAETLANDGSSGQRIQIFHDASYDPPVPTKSVTTRPATNIAQTAATLNGLIYDNSSVLSGTYGFEWGTTTSYGSSANDSSPGSLAPRLIGGSYGTGSGQIANVNGVAKDSLGNIYVADSGNHKVVKYNAVLQTVIDEFGGPGGGDGQFDTNLAVAVDSNDYVYVTDYYSSVSGGQTRIQKFDSNGNFILKWGSYGSGNGQFQGGIGLAIDSQDNVYHLDQGNNRVQKFDSNGAYIGQWGSAGSGNGQFNQPRGIAVGLDDRVYVVDASNNRIQAFNSDGTFLFAWGSNGSGNGQFSQLVSVATDQTGTVYVVDNPIDGSYPNGRLSLFQADGSFVSTMVTSQSGTFPRGVVVNQDGSVVISSIGSGTARLSSYARSSHIDVSSLACGTTYHYRSKAMIYGSAYYGDDTTFATSACNPDPGGGSDITITTTSLNDSWVDHANGQQIQATGITGDAVFSISSGIAPTGMSVSQSGYWYGTPSAAGTYNFTIQAEENGHTDTQSYTLLVHHYRITDDEAPDGEVNQPYSFQVQTEDGKGALYGVGHSDGTLPPGLWVNSEGLLQGTPTTAGTYNFTLYAIDSDLWTPETSRAYQVTIAPQQTNIQITTSSLNDATIGSYYSDSIQVDNTVGFQGCSVASGELPPGVNLDSNCYLSGTVSDSATPNSTYTFTVQAEDSLGSVTKELSIFVNPFPQLEFGSTTLPDGEVGDNSYYASISAYGGFGYKTYTLFSGNLPPGLTLDSNGYITGTPEVAGDYTFNLAVSDLTGTIDAAFYIKINSATVSTPRTNTPIITITSPANNTQFDMSHDSVTITGTGPANKTITTYMDNQMLGTTTASNTGTWEYTVHNIFPGNHSFDAKWIPQGDLAVVPGVFYNLATGDEDSMSSTIAIVDTATMETVKTLYLPEISYLYSSSINHAGTKAYVVGFSIENYASRLWEVDLETGVVTRASNLIFEDTSFVSVIVSDDDASAYLVSGGNDATAGIIKVNLNDFTMDESWVSSIPFSSAEQNSGDGLGSIASIIGTVQSHGNMYNGGSTDESDTDLRTATSINIASKERSGITILDEPRWQDCQAFVDAAGDNVYFLSNDKISVVDPVNNQVIRTITVDGLADNQSCAADLTVDAIHQKAFVLTGDGVRVVNLANETTTTLGAVPSTVVRNALRESLFQYFKDNAEVRQYFIDHPEAGVDPDNPDQMVDQLLDEFENNSENGFEISTFVYSDLSSDSQRLYLGTSIFGTVVSLNTETLQYEAAGGPLSLVDFNIYLGGGNFADHTIAPRASINFSVAQGTVVLPPITPPVKSPVIPENPEPPTVTDVTPVVPTPQPAKGSPIAAPNSATAVQNNLFALAKRIPEPFAVGFPWFLLALALALVAIQYYQVSSESTATKRIQNSVDHQKQLVEEQNNFVALSTHYLHTPLTVMEGEITLMVRAGTLTQAQANKLKATLSSLNNEAEAALAQEEQHELNN